MHYISEYKLMMTGTRLNKYAKPEEIMVFLAEYMVRNANRGKGIECNTAVARLTDIGHALFGFDYDSQVPTKGDTFQKLVRDCVVRVID